MYLQFKSILLFAIALLLSGCVSKVWVIEQRLDGGVIGYQGADRDDFRQKFDGTAQDICRGAGWQVTRDSLRSSQGSYMTYQTQKTHVDVYGSYGQRIGAVEGTTQVPMTQNYTAYWREAEIQCLGTARNPTASNRPMIGVKMSEKPSSISGVLVEEVVAGSPAEDAGIRAGDTLVEVGYRPVRSINDVVSTIGSMSDAVATSVKFCTPSGDCKTREIAIRRLSH